MTGPAVAESAGSGNQHNAWMTANNNYHGSPAGKPKRPFNVQADANCATVSMDHTP